MPDFKQIMHFFRSFADSINKKKWIWMKHFILMHIYFVLTQCNVCLSPISTKISAFFHLNLIYRQLKTLYYWNIFCTCWRRAATRVNFKLKGNFLSLNSTKKQLYILVENVYKFFHASHIYQTWKVMKFFNSPQTELKWRIASLFNPVDYI